ncbi:hypothetical protein [Desulfuribacillus alkaliarsenatis]|uniref:Uncharacterized protein n=1 Tax=Desulfuribacillus alkaliarsenatis TaxID=766136 RepID=A0A1E5FYM9_9FIRM|nr:hypothetical protein [Desulfuribacillus alkaliarsenatis]OEF95683.1 hypothetical protein BHF68_11290 [Desulfuribacillus alkaliarsenatis]
MDKQKIKQLFSENTKSITLNDGQKQKLIAMRHKAQTQTPMRRFMETEIRIPMPAFSAVTVACLAAGFMFLSSLLLPGDVPQPRYQIIEMQMASSLSVEQKTSNNI